MAKNTRIFSAYAMIDGTRTLIKIEAVTLKSARAKFNKLYPGNPIPDLQ